ncbi:Imm49 family immunity protein [Vibrio sp. NTOU-M3]|uniref:Imm49 family immunity protein n=1 Tax=Vibrio sp. NTOU-M3 TaxID=3234954 RepID=UPI00349F3A66
MNRDKKNIATHIANLSGEERLYKVTLSNYYKVNQYSLEDTTGDFYSFKSGFEKHFKLLCVGHHLPSVSRDMVYQHLQKAQEYALLRYRELTAPKDETIHYHYQGRDFYVQGKGKEINVIDGANWIELAFLTIVSGRYQDLNFLMEMLAKEQVEFLSEQSYLMNQLYLHCLGLMKHENIEQLIEDLMTQINLNKQSSRGKAHALCGITITLGFFDVMKAIHTQDEIAFRAAMKRALEMHKEWWTHSEEFSNNPSGYIAFPLLTATKYAKEKYGYSLDFESDYLPIDLI